MAPFVEREWGRTATEMMWRIKGLADPAGMLGPGHRPQPRSRLPPREPEDDAADRGGRDDLRRVRVLRAGLPEPEPDDHAAAADRPAPRDGPPARRLAAAGEADRGIRVRRPADLRRRRHLRDDLPARHRHRRARQGAACRASTASGSSGRRCGRRSAGPTFEAASRAGLRAGAAISRALGDGAAERRHGRRPPRRQRRAGAGVGAADAAAGARRRCRRRSVPAPRPSTCRPA